MVRNAGIEVIGVRAPVVLSTSYQAMSAPPLMYATYRYGAGGASICGAPSPCASLRAGVVLSQAVKARTSQMLRMHRAYAHERTGCRCTHLTS